ncbi:MAG: hypothetical protein ACH6QQ_00555 [Candidatus Carsonella ruddii]
MINIIKKHFLSLNRILENYLLLNTIYLIIIIIIFTIIILIFIIFNKKKFLSLIDSKIIELLIWLVPSIIIIILSIYTIKSSFLLNPFKILYYNLKPLNIEIISLNWKWIVIYPLQKILLFNEIVLPILIPIKITLSSSSLMNTLCIPKLGQQLYCMNNCKKIINILILKHGFCHASNSNYSGIGSINLKLTIFSVTKKNFFFWINYIKKSIYFNIFNYNYLIIYGYFNVKFFKIRNNKIFLTIIKKK